MKAAQTRSKPVPEESLPVADSRNGDLERRRELGQFFTSPAVTSFIWDLLGVIHGGPFPAHTRFIDPACGEGVFLRVAHERSGIPAKNLFGADIDTSLMPGWKHDSLLCNANLRLANGLLDDPAKNVTECAFDIVAGNPPFSGKGLRDLLRLLGEPMGETTRHEEQDFFEAGRLKEETPLLPQPITAAKISPSWMNL